MKRIYIAVLSFVLLLVLTICDREEVSSTAMPEITIHMDGKVIQSQTLSREVGIELDDESALFQAQMKDSAASIPYVKLGETIHIDFDDKAPDTYEVKDYILDDEGRLKYDERMAKPLNIEFADRKATFKLESNLAAFLSSNSKDYEPGATIRGFHLTGKWADQTKDILFVVRTDAK
ncbi:hypothetical protein [Paenibacillus sp. FSL H3-0286]|uniref:hypothetical protein n=1 Tax=Paenibacillus sp. FSL H3-0286 TaxID=2921427 RepID=UPI00324AF84A